MNKYELGADVSLRLSGEKGIVVGRADYLDSQPQIQVAYVTVHGEQKREWFTVGELA